MKKTNKHKYEGLILTTLERVCGGVNLGPTPEAPDDFYVYYGGKPMNASTAFEVLGGIYRAYGRDIAIDFAKNNWIPTRDWEEYEAQGGIDYAVQMLFGKMYHSYITHDSVF